MPFTSHHPLHIIRYTEVVSTNQIALESAEQGAQHGTVIVAVKQSGGRGRLNRSFSSPPGGLYFSLILRPDVHPERLALLTLISGVVCCMIVEKVSGPGVMLKWPNDLYLADRKLGGILCESAAYSERTGKMPFLIVGIGLNINTALDQFPRALQDTVISLFALRKKRYDLDQMMLEIAGRVIECAADPEHINDILLAEWRQRDYLYGRKIQWHGAAGHEISGVGAGLLRDGRYGLQTAAGEIIPIVGGELAILKADGD